MWIDISHVNFKGISIILSEIGEKLKKQSKIAVFSGFSVLASGHQISNFHKFSQLFSELRQNYRNSLKFHVWIINPHLWFSGISIIPSQPGEKLKKRKSALYVLLLVPFKKIIVIYIYIYFFFPAGGGGKTHIHAHKHGIRNDFPIEKAKATRFQKIVCGTITNVIGILFVFISLPTEPTQCEHVSHLVKGATEYWRWGFPLSTDALLPALAPSSVHRF